MHDEAILMQSLLRDSSKTSVDVVTTPEPLPIHETLELCTELKDALELPVHRLYVNCVPQARLSNEVLTEIQGNSRDQDQVAQWVIGEEQYARTYQSRLEGLNELGLQLRFLPEIDSLGYEGLTDAHLKTLLEAGTL